MLCMPRQAQPEGHALCCASMDEFSLRPPVLCTLQQAWLIASCASCTHCRSKGGGVHALAVPTWGSDSLQRA